MVMSSFRPLHRRDVARSLSYRSSLTTAILAALLLALAFSPVHADTASDAFPRTVVDGLGVEIVLESAPQRIFSGGLAMENILLFITDPERVIGVTRFALDSASGSYVADRIQDHMFVIDQLNAEQIIAADPDIVLVAAWSDPDAVKQIKDLGYPVYTFTAFDTVQDALDNIVRIGEITGDEAAAQALVDEFEQGYAVVKEKIDGLERPVVLNYDSWGSTTGIGTSVHDIIEMAGGVNAAALQGLTGWPMIDAEAIVVMNPDVIITESGDDFVASILADTALASVSAVENGRVYNVEHMGALNHLFLRAIEDLAAKLHPDVF